MVWCEQEKREIREFFNKFFGKRVFGNQGPMESNSYYIPLDLVAKKVCILDITSISAASAV